ncbi:unnamed protein product [Mytilus coruscus]|uniref:B box-type domain-containing protein n=1 Tax=Mytilus coruscus TaxID=42192 RepID=A0A6J8DQQ7_MYTCO|nr:unnamed protein product [Mytilus coruscus]
METNISICGSCSFRHTTKVSTHWCPDCEEAICDECREHHKVLRITRNHIPIPISKYKSLPSFVTDIQQSCIYHNKKYQQYCSVHDVPICYRCIKDHGKCNVIPLDEIVDNAKTSEQLRDLEVRLADLIKNVDNIKKHTEANVATIEDQKRKHIAEVKKLRSDINKMLDKLEKDILESLEEKANECGEKIKEIIAVLTERETATVECQNMIENIKQNATDFQTFIGLKDVEEKVSEKEHLLQSLMETNALDQLELVCFVDTEVCNILQVIKQFGSTEIRTHANDICLSRTKDIQAQLLLQRRDHNINDLGLRLLEKISIGSTFSICIRGCCISQEGKILFTDHNTGSVYTTDADGFPTKHMSLRLMTFDVVFIDSQTAAVTLSDTITKSFFLGIIDFKNRTHKAEFALPGRPYGITRDGNSLFICVEGYGICEKNMVNFDTCSVIKCEFLEDSYSYIAVHADKIYYTNYTENSVFCCDRNGSNVWTFFRDVSILQEPMGITVDDDGIVYVVGRKTANVLALSRDGNQHKELLTKEDGLCLPSAIFCDKQNKSILVANLRGPAFLYNISRD